MARRKGGHINCAPLAGLSAPALLADVDPSPGGTSDVDFPRLLPDAGGSPFPWSAPVQRLLSL